jgi:hypothetical protein
MGKRHLYLVTVKMAGVERTIPIITEYSQRAISLAMHKISPHTEVLSTKCDMICEESLLYFDDEETNE